MTAGIRYPGERLPRPVRRLARLLDLAVAARAPMLVPTALGLTAAPRVEFRLDGVRYALATRPVSELRIDLGILWEVCLARVYPIPADDDLSILDIGAHRGHFTVWAATRRPDAEIHAYEPAETNARELVAAVERNGCAGRVVVRREAVAGSDGPRPFRAGMRSDAGRLDPDGGAPIPAVALATALARCRPGPVFIKMDAEGSEHEAFAALAAAPEAARRIVGVAMEWHPSPSSAPDVRDSLTSLGFEVQFRQLRAGFALIRAWRRSGGRPGTATEDADRGDERREARS